MKFLSSPAPAREYPVVAKYWQKILRTQVQGEPALPPSILLHLPHTSF